MDDGRGEEVDAPHRQNFDGKETRPASESLPTDLPEQFSLPDPADTYYARFLCHSEHLLKLHLDTLPMEGS